MTHSDFYPIKRQQGIRDWLCNKKASQSIFLTRCVCKTLCPMKSHKVKVTIARWTRWMSSETSGGNFMPHTGSQGQSHHHKVDKVDVHRNFQKIERPYSRCTVYFEQVNCYKLGYSLLTDNQLYCKQMEGYKHMALFTHSWQGRVYGVHGSSLLTAHFCQLGIV